jgi:hypothetical protein
MRPVIKTPCPLCQTLISCSNIKLHLTACGSIGNAKEREKASYKNIVICQFCSKVFSTSQARAGHEYRVHSSAWKTIATKLGKQNIHLCRASSPKRHTEASKRKLSIIAHKRHLGGQFCGRHLWFTRASGEKVHFHSSYEIKVATDLEKNGIAWTRPGCLFWLDEQGIQHRYYPDFYLPKYNVFLDPKNDYLIRTDSEKIVRAASQNAVKVLILRSTELSWEKIQARLNSSIIPA